MVNKTWGKHRRLDTGTTVTVPARLCETFNGVFSQMTLKYNININNNQKAEVCWLGVPIWSEFYSVKCLLHDCVLKVLHPVKRATGSDGNPVLKKKSFPSFGYRHIFLAFLVWFHGTLDRSKSSLVKKWYNNIVVRDESPLISRSLSNPTVQLYCSRPAGKPSPASKKAQSWHHTHALWQMDGGKCSRKNI